MIKEEKKNDRKIIEKQSSEDNKINQEMMDGKNNSEKKRK